MSKAAEVTFSPFIETVQYRDIFSEGTSLPPLIPPPMSNPPRDGPLLAKTYPLAAVNVLLYAPPFSTLPALLLAVQ